MNKDNLEHFTFYPEGLRYTGPDCPPLYGHISCNSDSKAQLYFFGKYIDIDQIDKILLKSGEIIEEVKE